MQFRYQDLDNPSAAQVASLSAANATDLNTLRAVTIPGFARVLLDLRARLQAIAGNPRNSALAMADDTATARSEAASAIEQLEETAQQAAGHIYARLDKATEGAPDVQQAILDELQEQRAWSRALMALDAGQDVLEVIQAAGVRQDRAALRALRDELPAYLDAHRQRAALRRQHGRARSCRGAAFGASGEVCPRPPGRNDARLAKAHAGRQLCQA